MGEDWSELLPDLLFMIARKIQVVKDFTAFRGVCTSWRGAASKQDFNKPWPRQFQLLMLSEKQESDDREFISLSKGPNIIWKTLSLPEIRGKRCIESRGWLITLGNSGEVNLLNPFSHVQIELPNQTTFPEYEYQDLDNETFAYTFLQRAVLSASPSDTSDFVFMVSHGCGFSQSYWRPGDKSWTGVKRPEDFEFGAISDLNYYNGKFYAIDFGGSLCICDVFSGPDDYKFERVFRVVNEFFSGQVYLVESSGELLLVHRDGTELHVDQESYGVKTFQVFQLDLINRERNKIKSLGDKTIFVGFNSAISLDVTCFSGIIEPNCIYFTDDSVEAYTWTKQGGGKDMGVYNLENRKIQRFDHFQSFSLISPPVWVMISI
ncbi:hypothetical protein ACH5RR_040588 [Cinchona calisaya]|uniref:KIB1-4 beta-propeller domain-containing protein n=1 Tax=Cinchona calisaya TaxID=153742 RepID=A0ABD2XS18_9GENT